MALEYRNIIKELTEDGDHYDGWFMSSTDSQKDMIWKSIWDEAALNHADNQFVQQLYDFYQLRGYLTYRQWCYLIRVLDPSLFKLRSLKDRQNDL
jgi:hypothetical protein